MAKLENVEGIGATYAKKLTTAGLKTTGELLEACKTRKGRSTVAKTSGVSEKRLLSWANKIDLFRVKGVGTQYSDLLEAAGVDTVVELAKRKPENLLEAMHKTSARKHLVRRPPSRSEVDSWVKQAKKLPRVIKY